MIQSKKSRLERGDVVRVKSEDEIRANLDASNQLKGCLFMEEMRPYCGTEQRVLKRVEQFLEEHTWLVKECNGVVILDGVQCQGTKDYPDCDRSCFLFWRQEWLDRITQQTVNLTASSKARNENTMKCQIHGLDQIAEPLSSAEALWQKKNRLQRIVKRRCKFVGKMLSDMANGKPKSGDRDGKGRLEARDEVRVKTKEEIKATLDRWNRCKGCDIMEEMYAYCGTTQRVLKRLEKFVDERDFRFKKCNGIVLLDKVFCEGTVDYGRCDRNCYFFWREEWLEKKSETT